MIKKSSLERIIGDDLAELWNALTPDEKRIIAENFHYERYKKTRSSMRSQRLPKISIAFLKAK